MAGRPSGYTTKKADEICRRISEGESMRAVCRDDAMPDRQTVYRWMDENADFAAKCARARERQSDAFFDRMEDVCEAVKTAELDPRAGNVILSSLQWRAAKLAPKKYGDRLDMNHSGEVSLRQVIEALPIVKRDDSKD